MIEFKATNEWYKKAAELESGLEFTCSSGNVFQDLGYPDADDHLQKVLERKYQAAKEYAAEIKDLLKAEE